MAKKKSPAKSKVKKAGPKSKAKKGAKSKIKGYLTAYLGLGSNVGDREEYIEQAVFLLEKNPNIEVAKRSSNYETEPEGGVEQPPFINAAIEIRTKLSPQKLLDVCQEIETALGREREMEWGPRTIDIDILLYGDQVVSEDRLQIPHPLLHERAFVLKPLREIAPHALHPILEKEISSLYDDRKAEAGDKYDDELPGFREIKGGGYDDYERW
ncbi:2-amino-4-hydroxy-6-hydroxymethyldihydropteridine diphosphokinase [candidate division WOR-1 bacterium RIFOXYB2_FULL_48_7]|uniref:2-amino-4-hydroxy-6-hydroxymethyldihydropteridine diphosphokinase n=1 Tax=candidate division WOR-1 bacterium RIFOXYB2_FULL_48_7 TaxID=1802583 RepID=A0A1F4TDP1_UNCSA|nr:MAG: 2-amino-4-hydroxy-6-hydroxymethyldihydropteridine diphosphokinase [candidate division WOR-1 bacterium RIFOXYB2_FULL_48_7]